MIQSAGSGRISQRMTDRSAWKPTIIWSSERWYLIRRSGNISVRKRWLPVYIEVEDGLRLARAVERERRQAEPKYAELCRRFLADAEDFSEENLARAGISRRFVNNDLDECLSEIEAYIRQ